MGDIKINIAFEAIDAWNIQDVAAGATIAGIVIALYQYIGTSRSNARAHMHSIFREYLAIRMNKTTDNAIAVIGYRYYAMEEAFTWLEAERSWLKLPFGRMRKKEYTSWINTINHHVDAALGSPEFEYFTKNQLIFGVSFRKHVRKRLGI